MTGKVRAEESGQMEYRAPDKKAFVTTSESGSLLVRRMAFKPLITNEIEAASAKEHHDSARLRPQTTPSNFLVNNRWGLIAALSRGRCQKGGISICLKEKYGSTLRTMRSSESPGIRQGKSPFWIEQVDFVREYQKVDGFLAFKRRRRNIRESQECTVRRF